MIRAIAALLLSVGTSACGTAESPARPAEALEAQRLDLSPADADVWAREIRVAGAWPGPRTPSWCAIEAGGVRHAAAVEGVTFSARVPLHDGDNRVRAVCRGGDRELRSDVVRYTVRLTAGLEALFAEGEPRAMEPLRHAGAIVYGVVPPLYGEPPLRGVTAALDGLAELGVTALWLSPIFGTLPSDFGYAVTDYFAVRADYGTAADLRDLIAQAHARGLQVLLDFVPNHTSESHPYFAQARALGRRSHYFDFYDRDALGRPTHYFDWKHLPNLDYENAEVERFIIEASGYWLRAYDADGYRVDAAWGVALRDPAFPPRWTAGLRRLEPDAFLIAEASARDDYSIAQGGYDAAYDWTDELGQWAWKDVFGERSGIGERLLAAVQASAARVPPERVLRFLNNNDTGDRFITRHGEPLTRVATAALLTLPGLPCLYSFDEVGGEFRPYEQEGPLHPEPRPALRLWHVGLIALRRANPALHGPGFEPIATDAAGDTLAFVREAAEGQQHALVALNFAASPVAIDLPLPERLRGAAARYRDALRGGDYAARRGVVRVRLAGFEAAVLLPISSTPRRR